MLFIHVITGLLIALSLLSLRTGFVSSSGFIAFSLLGLVTSWQQQKKNKSIPYLKILLNITFIALTIKALLPFFINKPSDILEGLIKTWIYFLILSTFSIRSERDYYFIHISSLGLIIFSCLEKTTPGIILLNYILAFFIIWIIALRGLSLSKDTMRIKQALDHKKGFYREFKIIGVFLLATAIITLPIFLIIPRLDTSLPLFLHFVKQKNISTYTDFTGKSLISFFSPSNMKLSLSEVKKKESEVNGINRNLKTKAGAIDLRGAKTRPVFWHSDKETPSGQEKVKEKVKRQGSFAALLIRLLILAIFLTLFSLVYCIFLFFLPYLKDKNKIKTASRELKHNIFILLLFNFLCRVLNIFGYGYPVVTDPEEHSIEISRKFGHLQNELKFITALFLKARYSSHQIIKEETKKALSSYAKILKELKKSGTFWQRVILRLDFVFRLEF